jgi:quinol monooxygenase YgiN
VLAPLLDQARKEPGTLLYAVHRSADDPEVFWTTEVYADDAAFAAHRATEVHAAAEPVFTDLIAMAGTCLVLVTKAAAPVPGPAPLGRGAAHEPGCGGGFRRAGSGS